MEMGSVTGLGGETATLDLSKGLTPHYYFNFGVYLQVVGERRSTRAEERVLHFDLNFGALKLLSKESLKLTIKLDVINQIIFDDSEPRTVLISCHDDRRYLLDFQNPEENLLFRTAYAAVVENTFDISTFNRSLLLKGPVQKKTMRGFQDRYLILVPRKLYIMSSKTAIYPRSVLSLLDANPRYDEARGTVHLDVMGKEYVFRATGGGTAAGGGGSGGGGGGGGEGHSREETLEWFVALAHGCGLPPMFMEEDNGGGGGYGPSQFQQQPWHQNPAQHGPGPGRSPRGPGSVGSAAGFGAYGNGGGAGGGEYYGNGGDGAVSEAGSVRTAASRYTSGGFSYTAGVGPGVGGGGGGVAGSPVVQAYARLGSMKSYRHTAASPGFLKRSATGGPPPGSVSGPSGGGGGVIPLPGMPQPARDRGGDRGGGGGGIAAWHAAQSLGGGAGGSGGGARPPPPPGSDMGGDGNGGGNGGYRSPGVSPGRLARNGSLPGPLPLRAGLVRSGRNGSLPGPWNTPPQPGVEVQYRFEGVTGPPPTGSPASFYDRHTATTARGIMRDKSNTSPWITDTAGGGGGGGGSPYDGTPRPRTPPAPRHAPSPQSQQQHQPQRAYQPRSGPDNGGGGGGGGGGYQGQQRGGGYGREGGWRSGYNNTADYVGDVYGTDVDGLDEDPEEEYEYGQYAASDGGRGGADRARRGGGGGGGRAAEGARRHRSKAARGGGDGGDSSDVSSRDATPPRRRGSADDHRGHGRGLETPSPPVPAPQARHGSASSTGSGTSSGNGGGAGGGGAGTAAATGRYASPLGSRSAHKASLPTVYERGDTDGESPRPSPQHSNHQQQASQLAAAAAAAGAALRTAHHSPPQGSPPVAGSVPLPPPPPSPPVAAAPPPSGPDPFELLADIQARLRSLSAESNAAAEAAEVAAKLGSAATAAAAAAGINGGLSAATVAALNAAAAATHVAPTTEGRTAAAPWSHSPLPYQVRNTTGEDVSSTWLRNRQMSAWSTGTTDHASIMTPQQLQQAQLQQAQQQALARTAAESSVAPPLHTYTSSSTTATFASAAAAAGPYGTAPLPPGYSSASGSPASGPGGYPGGSVSAAAGGRGLPLTSLSAIHGLPAAGATAAGGEPWRAPAQSLGTLAAAAAAARGVGLGGPNAWRLRAEVIDTPLLKPSVIARNNRYLRGRMQSIACREDDDPLAGHRRALALLQWTFANYESLTRDGRNMEPQVLLAAADDEMSPGHQSSSGLGGGGGPQSTMFRSRRDRIASALTDWLHLRRAQPSLPWTPRAQPRTPNATAASASAATASSPRQRQAPELQPQQQDRSAGDGVEARWQRDSGRRSPCPTGRAALSSAPRLQQQQRQPSPPRDRRDSYSSFASDTDADVGRGAGRGRDDGSHRQRSSPDTRHGRRQADGPASADEDEDLHLHQHLRHHETLDLDFEMEGADPGSDLLDTCDRCGSPLRGQEAPAAAAAAGTARGGRDAGAAAAGGGRGRSDGGAADGSGGVGGSGSGRRQAAATSPSRRRASGRTEGPGPAAHGEAARPPRGPSAAGGAAGAGAGPSRPAASKYTELLKQHMRASPKPGTGAGAGVGAGATPPLRRRRSSRSVSSDCESVGISSAYSTGSTSASTGASARLLLLQQQMQQRQGQGQGQAQQQRPLRRSGSGSGGERGYGGQDRQGRGSSESHTKGKQQQTHQPHHQMAQQQQHRSQAQQAPTRISLSDFPTLPAQHASGAVAAGVHSMFAAGPSQPQGYSHVAIPGGARVSVNGGAGGSGGNTSNTSGYGGNAAVLELQQDISSVLPGMSLTLRVRRPNSPSTATATAAAAAAGAGATAAAPAPGFSFRPASAPSPRGGSATGRNTPNAGPASPPQYQHALQYHQHPQQPPQLPHHHQQAHEEPVTWSQLHSLLQTHLYGGSGVGGGGGSGALASDPAGGSRAAWEEPTSVASAPDGPAARALAAALAEAAATVPGSAATSAGGAPMSPSGEAYRPISNPLFNFSSAEASPDAPAYNGRGDGYAHHQHQQHHHQHQTADGTQGETACGVGGGDLAELLRALQQSGLALPADEAAIVAALRAGAQRDARSAPPQHSPPRAAPRAASPPHLPHPHQPAPHHHHHHRQPDLQHYLGSPAAAPASPLRRPSISPMTPEASRSIQHAAAMAAEAATSAVTEAMSALGRIGSSYSRGTAGGGSAGASPPRLSAGGGVSGAMAALPSQQLQQQRVRAAWRHGDGAGGQEHTGLAEVDWPRREWARELERDAAAAVTARPHHDLAADGVGGATGAGEAEELLHADASHSYDDGSDVRSVDGHQGGGGSAAAGAAAAAAGATAGGMAYRAQSLQSLLQLVNTGRVPHDQLLGLLAHGGLSSVLRQPQQPQQLQ